MVHHSLFYLLNHYSHMITSLHSKLKVSLFYVLEQNLLLQFDEYHFSIYLKSLYKSYLLLCKLFLILFFTHPILNQIFASTSTIISPVVSDNGQTQKWFFDYLHFSILIRALYEWYVPFYNFFLI